MTIYNLMTVSLSQNTLDHKRDIQFSTVNLQRISINPKQGEIFFYLRVYLT